MKTLFVRYGLLIAALALVAGCTSVPASNPTAAAQPTLASVVTVAPGSTEAPGPTAAPASSEVPPSAQLPEPTLAADEVPTEAPTATPEPGGLPTTAPEATLPPAPTAEPAPPATVAPTAAPMPTAAEVIACMPGQLTPGQTEGPYYKANPPQRSSLVEPGMAGTTIVITGYVFNPECRPIAGARVDFWQTDAEGRYDNAGYRLRGYTVADSTGRYAMETVVPGLYTGRTSHIHVKVSAPNGPELTTQLYMPGEPANQRDRIYRPALDLTVEETAEGLVGRYSFVINEK